MRRYRFKLRRFRRRGNSIGTLKREERKVSRDYNRASRSVGTRSDYRI